MVDLTTGTIKRLLHERVSALTQKTIAQEERFFAFPCGGGWLLEQNGSNLRTSEAQRGGLQ